MITYSTHSVGEQSFNAGPDEPSPSRAGEQSWDEEAAGDGESVGPTSKYEVERRKHSQSYRMMGV